MNHDAVDDIFTDGLGDMNFGNKEVMWQRLEKDLDQSKKRRFFWILGSVVSIALVLLFFIPGTTNHVESPQIASVRIPVQKKSASTNNSPTPAITAEQTAASQPPLNSLHPIPLDAHYYVQRAITKRVQMNRNTRVKPGITRTSLIAGTVGFLEESGAVADFADLSVQDQLVVPAKPATGTFYLIPVASLLQRKNFIPSNLPVTTTAVAETGQTIKRYSIEAVAGSDIFHLKKNVGYYGGIRLSRNLDKRTAISAGINYSYNALSEKYRLSDKPLQQQETDAQLNNLKMLRFPVMIQLQMPNTRISLMAGLTPSYILSASIYNVPPTTSGNPANYREFTIKDINRFNLLFGAGIKYNLTNRLAVELSGSYGFTELVKDSYINQSNVNDNFKNIQAGLVWKLR